MASTEQETQRVFDFEAAVQRASEAEEPRNAERDRALMSEVVDPRKLLRYAQDRSLTIVLAVLREYDAYLHGDNNRVGSE